MGIEQTLFIPEFAGLLVGVDYDMALSDRADHENTHAENPIEDPERSFLMDHNREKPTRLQFKLQVSTQPADASRESDGPERLGRLYDELLYVKKRQTVALDAFLTVYTGVRTYSNMAIRTLRWHRTQENGNQGSFDISLVEFRFAMAPTLQDRTYLMYANTGTLNVRAKPVVSPSDALQTQATRVRQRPQIARPQSATTARIEATVLAT